VSSLYVNVERVNRLTRRHQKTIPSRTSEADISADFGQRRQSILNRHYPNLWLGDMRERFMKELRLEVQEERQH
jgi:hypothetical protein